MALYKAASFLSLQFNALVYDYIYIFIHHNMIESNEQK